LSGRRKRPEIFTCVVLVLGLATVASAQQAPPKYEKYIQRFPDNRALWERLLNRVDVTLEEIGPAFALVAGIDSYPKLKGRTTLKPAGVDIDKLVDYLEGQERFLEIVVLRNEAVTLDNLGYFLQRYFPDKLKGVPKGRFLLAFSGHGVQEGEFGYLLQPDAERLDAEFGINLGVVKGFYSRILHHAHQSLVLINACHAGALLERESFGRVVPLDPGHWAITAGGDAGELVWHDKKVGPGSIFFEKFFAALDGRADRLPEQSDGSLGDGLVTVEELFTYLKAEVQLATRQSQNPRMGNISLHGDHGSFFFFNKKREVAPPPPFNPTRSFGTVACTSASDCFSKGYDAHGRKAYDLALRLYHEACRLGAAAGCFNLGLMYERGDGVAKDTARAISLYRQTCDGGVAGGCSNLGIMYERGNGVAKDAARAVSLFRQACDGGDAPGCTNLGAMYQNGEGVAQDLARAESLFRLGCDGGVARGCKNLGIMYERGDGVAKDAARAVSLYRQACDGGDAPGCTNLGIMYERGDGVAKDTARAVSLYRQGCDGGNDLGCEYARNLGGGS